MFLSSFEMRLSQIAERIEFLDPEMKSASNRIDILETVSHGNAIRIQQLIAALLMTDDDKGQGNRATKEFNMSQEWLWFHALQFLDNYEAKSGDFDISELYNFKDTTGVLPKHQERLENPFDNKELDMKAMFSELIKMLSQYEEDQFEAGYKEVFDIFTIGGFGRLTTKMQMFLDKHFLREIDDLKKTNDKQQQQIDLLMNRLNEVEARKDNEQAQIANNIIVTMEQRIDNNDAHIKLLQDHEREQDEKIDSLAGDVVKVKGRLDELEPLSEKVDELEDDVKELKITVDNAKDDYTGLIDDLKQDELKPIKILIEENHPKKFDELELEIKEIKKDEDDMKKFIQETFPAFEDRFEHIEDDFNHFQEKGIVKFIEEDLEPLLLKEPVSEERLIAVVGNAIEERHDLDEIAEQVKKNKKDIADTNKSLTDDLDDLRSWQKRQDQDIDQLKEDNNATERKVAVLGEDQMVCTDRVGKAEDKIDKLQDDVDKLKKKINDVDDKSDDNKEKIHELEEKVANQQNHANVLEALAKKQDEAKQRGDADTDSFKDEFKELKEKVGKNTEGIKELEKAVEDAESKQRQINENVDEKLNNDKKNIDELDGRVADNKNEIEKLKKDSWKDVEKKLQDAIKDLKVEFEEDFKGLKDLIDAKIDEMDHFTDKNKKHVENLRELNNKLLDEFKKQLEKEIDGIEDRIKNLEDEVKKNTRDLSAIDDDLQGTEKELKMQDALLEDKLKHLNDDFDNYRNNYWTLLMHVYGNQRGCTMLLKSEGIAAVSQPHCMGVYRMIDFYNGRPLYKQDGNEHFLYYNAKLNGWMVGSRKGQNYGWIINKNDKSKRAKIPDLRHGWEYQPLAQKGHIKASWHDDDETLRVESLTDLEDVNIRKLISELGQVQENGV